MEKMTAAQRKQEREWQAQADLLTLQRAKEIQGDKGRLTAAQSQAQKQMNALAKVAPKPSINRKNK